MTYRTSLSAVLALALLSWMAPAQADGNGFTDEFPLEDCQFRSRGSNPYFPLRPGRQLHFSNQACVDEGECEELEEVWITVLHETKEIELEIDDEIQTVRTRIVEELETADGELAEVSRNYFVECRGIGDVYYFGEDVDDYEDGEIVGHDGAWLAGQDDAEPGLIMPGGAFLLGARYFQEFAPGIAADRAEHVDNDLEVEVPAGEFDDCVEIAETTPLDPTEFSEKIYCPGIGLVVDDDLELVEIVE